MAISKTINKNGTFSGTDISAVIVFPHSNPISIGELSTATYSVYREKHPVRTLSRISVKGFTKGPRTVAGTLIFTVFNKHIVNRIRQEVSYLKDITTLKVDELPPFDLYLTMGNEYGASSRLNIYGMTIVDEGKVFSVEDLFTENQWSYMARDIQLMDDIGAEQNRPVTTWADKEATGSFTADSLVLDDKYKAMLAEIAKLKEDRDKAIEEARKKALEKYTASYDDFEYEHLVQPAKQLELILDPNVDPDAVHHPDLSFQVRYDTFFTTEAGQLKAQTEFGRTFIVKIDIKDFSRDTLYDGKTVVVEATLGEFKQSWSAEIKDAHVICEVVNFYDWEPETPSLRVYIPDEYKTFTASGIFGGTNSYKVLSDSSQDLNNAGVMEYTFVFGESDGSTGDDQDEVVNGLKIDMSTYAKGYGSHNSVDSCTTQIFRDVIFDWDRCSYDSADGGWYTYEWMIAARVWSKYDGKKLDPDKCQGYFNMKITGATKDGQPYTLTRNDKNNIKVVADLKITVVVKGTGQIYTVDGANANGNIANLKQDIWTEIHKGVDIDFVASMSDSGGHDLYPIGDTMLARPPGRGIIDDVIENVYEKGSKTVKYQHLSAQLYNFRAVYKDTGKSIPLSATPPIASVIVGVIDESNVRQILWE